MFVDTVRSILAAAGVDVVDVVAGARGVTVRPNGSSPRDARYSRATVWVAEPPDTQAALEAAAQRVWDALYASPDAIPESRAPERRSSPPGSVLLYDLVLIDVTQS